MFFVQNLVCLKQEILTVSVSFAFDVVFVFGCTVDALRQTCLAWSADRKPLDGSAPAGGSKTSGFWGPASVRAGAITATAEVVAAAASAADASTSRKEEAADAFCCCKPPPRPPRFNQDLRLTPIHPSSPWLYEFSSSISTLVLMCSSRLICWSLWRIITSEFWAAVILHLTATADDVVRPVWIRITMAQCHFSSSIVEFGYLLW